MASNYWDSTQAKYWTFTKEELADTRERLRAANASVNAKYDLPEQRHVNIFLQQRTYQYL